MCSFLVLAVPLARPVLCPVLFLVLVLLFQLRRWLGREQSAVFSLEPCVPCSSWGLPEVGVEFV